MHVGHALLSDILHPMQPRYRNVQFTDIPKMLTLKPISVFQYEFFSHTDILKFPIY
jgi:hypothetical protein